MLFLSAFKPPQCQLTATNLMQNIGRADSDSAAPKESLLSEGKEERAQKMCPPPPPQTKRLLPVTERGGDAPNLFRHASPLQLTQDGKDILRTCRVAT